MFMDGLCNTKYVYQILKSGSITQAANVLGISQPALSMNLTQLESKLGFKVFNRKSVPISLTEEGRLYIEYLETQTIYEKEFLRKIEDLSNLRQKTVFVGSPNVYISSVLSPKICKILSIHPNLQLNILSGTVPELIEMCSNSNIDFFISTTKIADDNFDSVPLKKEDTYLCVPAKLDINNNLEFHTKDDLTILKELPFIFLHKDQPLQMALDTILSQNNIEISPIITVDQVTSALSFALEGAGVCLATSESLSAHRNSSQLHFYSFSDLIKPRTIYAVYHRDRYMSSACNDIIKILKEES